MNHPYKYLTVFLILLAFSRASAQTAQNSVSPSELQTRIRQLESQMDVMRDELTKLKQSLPARESTAAAPTQPLTTPSTGAAQDKKIAATDTTRTGIDLGPVRLTPYGMISFNAFGNSGGANNADVPLFATASGQGNMSATARQTRLGLRLDGPKLLGAKSSGAVEVDFYGGFPAIGIGENFGVVRLRLAYAKLDWKRTSLVTGQDWMVFAPVNPVSLASAAIPQLAAAGNPWTRLPQIRLEHRWMGGKLNWQGAVLSPATGDFPSGINSPALLQPGTGAASRVPSLQSRIALSEKNWLGLKKPGSIGLSVHYGRARIPTAPTNHQDIASTGLALDWSLPLVERVTLAGEAFTGRNLAGFQSGVFQGYNPDFAHRQGATLVPGGARAIGTRGGWLQLGWTPPVFDDHLTTYASFGIDDPRDRDLVSSTKRDWRLRNQAYALNFLYKISPQLTWAFEYRRLQTLYLQTGRQNNNHLNLGATFNF